MNLVEKYSQIFWSPFLTGVFMWVNAISDSALYVDWPDCIFWKSDFIYKTHDLFSELKDPSINTKLYFSWVMPNKMIRWYDNKIKRKISFIDENKKFNLWVVTCMPVTWLLAVQYNMLYDDFKTNFIYIPSFTDKFWIDGYSIFLKELAKSIQVDKTVEKKKLNISLIWFLFDRNEWDCKGNIVEIKRILGLIWVTINSIWLDWWKYKDLSRVEESELLVSLAYWKYASKVLSKKLNVDVLELELPFGLDDTTNFIKTIASKLWLDDVLVNQIIDKEKNIINNKLSLINNKLFKWKKFIYWWDPYLEKGIINICSLIWLEHLKTYKYNWEKVSNSEDIWDFDLVIWNSEFEKRTKDYVKYEFWFPSYNTHYLLDRPYMWFNWILFIIENLYEIINKKESKTFKNINNNSHKNNFNNKKFKELRSLINKWEIEKAEIIYLEELEKDPNHSWLKDWIWYLYLEKWETDKAKKYLSEDKVNKFLNKK